MKIDEYSCGALVYKQDANEFKFLIIRQNNKNYGFPKGHTEENETKVETAIREVLEETCINIEIHKDIFEISKYQPIIGVNKEVTIFLAKAKNSNYVIQEEELLEVHWMNFKEAKQIITFKKDIRILKKLNKKLKKIKG